MPYPSLRGLVATRGRRWLAAGLAILVLAAAGAWLWRVSAPAPAAPVRVGFRNSPPFYFAQPNGRPSGMAVEILNGAAARLAVPLQWTLISEPSATALREGRIDLWPTLPITGQPAPPHVTEPWLESSYFLVFRAGTPIAGARDVVGRAVTIVPGRLEDVLALRFLPGATLLTCQSVDEKISRVCDGSADAAFLDGREAQALLLARPACRGISLGFALVDGAAWTYGIGSTTAAAAVADRLRAEIERMGEDGTLAAIQSRWSFTTANELRFVYTLQQARLRTRLSVYLSVGLGLALLLSLWQVRHSRQARRLAEAASRSMRDYAHQQERYRLLFERNLAGVFRSTTDGSVLDCNDAFARMLGYDSREELLRHQAWEHYSSRADREVMLEQLRREGSIANYENALLRRDGSTALVLENVSYINMGEGQPAILEGTAIDITRQRQLEEQYRQAQKMESIGLLAGGVAHDFNNLLTAINGYSELVLGRLGPDSPLRGMMEEVAKAGRHAADLTQQLLAFSRKQILQPVVLDINGAVSDMQTLLRRVIGEDIELVTRLKPGLGNVKADPGQLQQVLMNLAVNARDAMPEGGRLTIETRSVTVDSAEAAADPDAVSGPCVLLTVADTGIGMHPETLRHAFEPFFTTKERGKGTGLGLSTVYGIVKQSGGQIKLRSDANVGTVFDIYLPQVSGEAPATESGLPASAREGSETILVVEDQDDVRVFAVEALRKYGYRVIDASRGDQALNLCRAEAGPIHVLLVDVVMPGMTGPDVAARISELRPGTKIVFMSGYTEDLLPGGKGRVEAAEFIRKPFTASRLAEKVREILGPPA